MKAGVRVAWNIRRLRVAQQVSQEKFAVDAGIDRTYVSRLERGRENPSVNVLEQIANALGVGIESLFIEPPHGDFTLPRLPSGRKTRRLD